MSILEFIPFYTFHCGLQEHWLSSIVIQCLLFYEIIKNICGYHATLLCSTGDRNIVFYAKEEQNCYFCITLGSINALISSWGTLLW